MARTAFVGATLIDGTGVKPAPASAILLEDGRIVGIGSTGDVGSDVEVVDVSGKFLIPGLLDANVHLVGETSAERLLQYKPGDYDEIVLEASQIALRAGVTTIFDTWDALPPLRRVRDRINAGEAVGSRIYCAGNIIGMDGPWSDDFHTPEKVVKQVISAEKVKLVNYQWEQGVGRDLLWMSAEDCDAAVREYIASSGIDFVKYSSSAHRDIQFIAFSPASQRAICDAAHDAGMTVQACAQAPEALKMAIDAGVDLLQHGTTTGRRPMPESTIDLIVERQLPCVAFLTTSRYDEAVPESAYDGLWKKILEIRRENDRKLIERGAKLLLAWDMRVSSAKQRLEDSPDILGKSHITWMRAAIELGMTPMNVLLSTTRNIAEAYHKADEVGTVEVGKRADLVVLDADPLADPENYARVAHVVQGGAIIDVDRLPEKPVMTRDEHAEGD